ncbi:hypothetical protein [Thermococcus sp.]
MAEEALGGEGRDVRKVVLEPSETKFMSRFVAFLLLLFIAVLIPTLLRMKEGAPRGALMGLLMYIIFAAVIVSIAMFSLRKIMKSEKAAVELASLSKVVGEKIVFPGELEFERGKLVIRAFPGRERPAKEFIAVERRKAGSVAFLNEEFRLAATPEGGFASLPAVRILSPPYERAVLLFMTDEGRVICRKSIRAEDSVHLSMEGKGKILRGRIYSAPGKVEKVSIFLSIPENERMEVKVAEGIISEFEYSMLPDEKTVIWAAYGALSLEHILRGLGTDALILGHGEFLVRFAVEGMLKKKSSGREKFKVVMGEEGW